MLSRKDSKALLLALLLYEHIFPITLEEHTASINITQSSRDFKDFDATELIHWDKNKVYHAIIVMKTLPSGDRETDSVAYFTTPSPLAIEKLRAKIS